jgi:hypothetical protein
MSPGERHIIATNSVAARAQAARSGAEPSLLNPRYAVVRVLQLTGAIQVPRPCPSMTAVPAGGCPSCGAAPVLASVVTSQVDEWVPCFCCGRSFAAVNMVSFERHPDHSVCVACTEWLYTRSRPIARRLSPIWKLPARIRSRATPAR